MTTSSSNVNTLLREDQPVHDWYRFVLAFPPHLVRTYLEKFNANSAATVLDPFCGTGTTLVECKKQGIPSIGLEANPVTCFASKVKTAWHINSDYLEQHAQEVANRANSILTAQGIIDDPAIFSANNGIDVATLKHLSAESENLLLENSISPLPLHKVLVLIETLNNWKNDALYDHERLAIANALITSISNLSFGPEVGIGTIKKDTPVIAVWLDNIRTISNHLRQWQDHTSTLTNVYLADAREMTPLLPSKCVDVVITSPPYPNEKDYTRITRLEAVLLGFVRNKTDLQSFKRTLMRSNTRNVYKGDNDDQWVAGIPEIEQLSEAIESRRHELGKTSGFERLYARVTKLYFGGIARHLADLRAVLRPGARLAYVVGDQASYLRVMIRTGQLVELVARRLGYESTGIDLFRTRRSTATNELLREEVVTLRWPGQ